MAHKFDSTLNTAIIAKEKIIEDVILITCTTHSRVRHRAVFRQWELRCLQLLMELFQAGILWVFRVTLQCRSRTASRDARPKKEWTRHTAVP